MLKLSERGAKFITEPPHEGLSLIAYPDSAGVWTIGFGTTTLNGAPVTRGMEINTPVAWALFNGKMQEYLNAIERLVRVRLNQNQVDALASFTYNIGINGFASSSLLKAINAKLIINEDLFTRWNKITDPKTKKKIVSNGLTNRRKREYKLFMEEVS